MQRVSQRIAGKCADWISRRRLVGWSVAERASRPRSLSWYLSVTKLIAALPLMATTLVLVGFIVNDDRQSRRAALVSEAHGLADVVGRELDKYFILSDALSHSVLLGAGEIDKFNSQAAAVVAQVPGATIVVSSPDGHPLSANSEATGSAAELDRRRELVRRAFATGRPFLSDVYVDPASNPRATIETPVFIDGKPLYELALVLTLDRFGELLNRQATGTGWLSGIVDRNGIFVARFPEGAGKTGSPASEQFRDAARQPADSVVSHTSVDGARIISAYSTISYGWTVGVAANLGLMDEGSRAPFLAALLVAAALASTIVLSYLNGRRLALKIKRLQGLSGQLVAGAPIVPPRTGVRELDALSGAMGKASTILRGRARQQEQMEEALRKSEEHFRILADSLPQLVWTAGSNGRIEYTNARRDRYGSGGLSRTDWESIIHPDDRRATAEAWLKSSESGEPYEKEHRLMVIDRGYVWHLSRAAPLRDAGGEVVRWYGTTTDIDEHKLREENIRSLMAEVNHRSRNLLAVAIAIARRSVGGGDAAREFEQKFSQRLLGLFASQDILTSHDWRGVPVEALVRAQSADRVDPAQKRIAATGPTISLNPSAAQTLGLALHELVSNAVKYGALSGEQGTVEVSWRIAEGGDEPLFEMEWRERGGPPIRRSPLRGFGSIVIERMAAFGLNGEATLSFDAEGVTWRLSAPLKAAVVAF